MKELDELLSRFARDRYPAAPAGQQAAFEALLTLPDTQIADYLLGHDTPADADLSAVIRSLLAQ
jgi:antitoxin CptB